MRILAFSDLHRDRAAAERIVAASAQADVVVGAGDFASMGLGLDDCLDVLRQIPAPLVIVAGNHEPLEQLRATYGAIPTAHVLHGDGVQLRGVNFFGVGFEIPGTSKALLSSQLTEIEGAQLLSRCPAGGVLVTHSPPFGLADQQADGSHHGSQEIRKTIESRQPQLHLCGHIHNAWGKHGMIGRCRVHNLGPTINWFTI